MTADWDEIKRLASDFQKAQLSSSLQKLTERNCVEIVQWLLQNNMINLIFTSDGKEYITPDHLVQEILGELYVHGGRINLVELSKIILIDLNHINNQIPDITRKNNKVHFVNGELIDESYITRIAEEINEKLKQQGTISVNDLTVHYNIPADFLQHKVVGKCLGRIIEGKQDPNDPKVFFTEGFISRTKAKIRGALMGLTRPTPASAIVSQIGIQEKLFFSLFDDIVKFGTLTSRSTGAQYVPFVYSRSQNEWVMNFYKQNGYLEFDALIRLGISDYKNYIKRQLSNENITTLNSCIVSNRIIEQLDADIEECISSKSYTDVQTNLPSVFNENDIKMVLDIVLTSNRLKQVLVLESFVISLAFIENLSQPCKSLVEEKAKQAVESGRYQQFQNDLHVSAAKIVEQSKDVEETKVDKREERRKRAAGGKAGGGAQGRETKTKSTKKHARFNKSNQVDSDEEVASPVKKTAKVFEVIMLDDIKEAIQSGLEEEGLDELLEPIAEYVFPKFNKKGLELAENLYASTITDQVASRKQTYAVLQDRLNTMLGDVRLFEKGAKLLPGETQTQLFKYLLKTLCTDVVNEIVGYLSSEYGIAVSTDSLTNEQRTKLVNDLPPEHRPPVQALIKTLTGSSIEDFMNAAENSLVACSMILKKIDKKKDRVIILAHKHSLLDQLEKCEDPALVLHLTTLILFEICTQNMIHASGRHVSAILSFLKQYLSEEQLQELAEYHDLVTSYLSTNEKEAIADKLREKMGGIKKIASEFKKSSSDK